MKFPMYFVDDNGVIHTVYSATRSTYSDNFNIVNTSYGRDIEVLLSFGDEKCVDEAYCLWDSLVALATKIEED